VARVDVSILKEIARIVQSRAKVPERIQVQNRAFSITYLDDHKQRIEEALRRHDPDRLNMLFGQLESKVKYQVIRRSAAAPKKEKAARPPAAKTHGSSRHPGKSTPNAPKRSQASSGPKRATKGSRATAAAAKPKKARKAAAKSPARKAGLRAKSGRKRR
jgi:hypothetical protein